MTKVLWLSLIQAFRYKCRFPSYMKLIELSYFHSQEQKDNPYFSCNMLVLKHRFVTLSLVTLVLQRENHK